MILVAIGSGADDDCRGRLGDRSGESPPHLEDGRLR